VNPASTSSVRSGSTGASASELVGRQLPVGEFRFEAYESWLLHDALYSDPGHERAHPVLAFVAAQRGLGISVAELFRIFGTEMAEGPMLTESIIENSVDLLPGVRYRVSGEVVSVVRKSGRTLGVFDLLTARFEVAAADSGPPDAIVTNVYALPRREVLA
jgi:hypothetical protein